MQLYVNYFDQERRTEGDNPTLGLILCTDKNAAVVKYLLGPDQSKKIFTSRYKLHLPTEADLVKELKREARALKSHAAALLARSRGRGRDLRRPAGNFASASNAVSSVMPCRDSCPGF
jgi:hypothetical protein